MIVGAVLAAGASTRLGYAKQLVRVDGEPLVRRAATALLGAPCERVGVILGANAELVAPVLTGMPVELVTNRDWHHGMGTSLGAAARWAISLAAETLVVCVCDQPRLTAAHLAALIAAHRAHGGAITASRYSDLVGVPAVFPRSAFLELAVVSGDAGARSFLRAPTTIAVEWPDGAFDIDTATDVATAQAQPPAAHGPQTIMLMPDPALWPPPGYKP